MKKRATFVSSIVFAVCFATGLYGNNDKTAMLEMEELVVTGTKTSHRIEDVPVETVLIPRYEIETSNAQNISEIIGSVPGFNFSQQAGTASAMGYKNTVRGLNVESRYLLILVNGQRVFTGYRSGGMAGGGFGHNINAVPVEMIDHIEIVKGPGSALYGSDAMVGVINIITRQPAADPSRTIGVETGSNEAKGNDFMGNKPSDTIRDTQKVYFTVSQNLDDTFGLSVSASHEENDGIHPEQYDISLDYLHGMVDIELADNLKLRLGSEFSRWKEKNDDSGDEKEETSDRYYSTISYDVSPTQNIRLQWYTQQMKQDFKDPLYGDSEADMNYSDIEFLYTGKFLANNQFILGYEHLKEDFDSSTVSDKQIVTRSWFIQDELTLFDEKVIVVPGVRVDDNDAYGGETNPKLSLMFKPLDDTTLRFSAGRSFKSPQADQAFGIPFNHIYMWIYPNPDLEPETSNSWQMSFDQRFFNGKAMVSLTYYEMKIDNMIAQTSRGDSIGGIPVVTWKNINEAEVRGIESMIGIDLAPGLDLDLTYTTTKSEDKDTEEELYDTPQYSYTATLRYIDGGEDFGGYASYSHTGKQKNKVYSETMSEETEPFSTVGLNAWFRLFNRVKCTIQADNLLDEELKGSDMIYTGRMLTAKLAVDF